MAYTTADIRNVCLLGPAEAGKTQLAEALLYAGGAIAQCGQVAKGNTVTDHSERERAIGLNARHPFSRDPIAIEFREAGRYVDVLFNLPVRLKTTVNDIRDLPNPPR